MSEKSFRSIWIDSKETYKEQNVDIKIYIGKTLPLNIRKLQNMVYNGCLRNIKNSELLENHVAVVSKVIYYPNFFRCYKE